MLEFIQKKGLIISLAVAGLIIGIFFIMTAGIDENASVSERSDVSFLLQGARLLLIIGAIVAIVLPLIAALKNPSVLIKVAIGLGALLLFYIIGSAVSDSLVLYTNEDGIEGFKEFDGAKFSGAILNTTYILLVVAVLSVIVAPFIKKVIK